MSPYERRWSAGAALAFVLLVASCSSGSAGDESSFGSAAVASVLSDGGTLRVEVRTSSGQPPSRGTSSIELRVTDAATSKPQDHLTVTVVPWMPFMGHGTSVKPTVTPEGEGRYLVTNVDLYMPGRWELRVTFSGALPERATPAFDIP